MLAQQRGQKERVLQKTKVSAQKMPVTYQEETSLPWSNWSLANLSKTNAKGRDPDIVGAVFSNYQHAKPPERAKIRGSGEAWSK